MKVGIVGIKHGLKVLSPAFQADPRCDVVQVVGSDVGWQKLLEQELDAVAIAVPPKLQPEIAKAALARGLAVFAEKPLAFHSAWSEGLLKLAEGKTTAVDFTFVEVPAFKMVKKMLDEGAIGRLRHVSVNWNVESNAVKFRASGWKTTTADGGGALGNFASHSLHYLEWFCGDIAEIGAMLSRLPNDLLFETGVYLNLKFISGVVGHYALNCGSPSGSGHRLEFYGENGRITLVNSTSNHMRGFVVEVSATATGYGLPLEFLDDEDKFSDAYVGPVSRLVTRFVDAWEAKTFMSPGFAEGARVDALLSACLKSARDRRLIGVGGRNYD